MPNYVIDMGAHAYKVHEEHAACEKMPTAENTRSLGWFSTGSAALFEAQKTFVKATTCKCAK